ncbi:S8 family peptidase [Ferviditalea candida]|uniref:S8 family peptidase n=1 Tax=Ferviditalea candida TaxID=3108399 RepID=A0ABU5ZEJ4_9BACL|nr:S8 family peptidase [Paenibacillaceae bacterium T2]
MRRTTAPLLIVITLLITLLPACVKTGDVQKKQGTEIIRKQSLLNSDIERTDQLCRTQCMRDFHDALKQIGRSDDENRIIRTLTQLIAGHGRMKQVIWSEQAKKLEDGVRIGRLPYPLDEKTVNKYFAQAKQAVQNGHTYQSPRIRQNGSYYFVLGVPSDQGNSSLIGLVRQEILSEVENHQKKNLRLVPYPGEKHWKLESVDSDTLRDTRVRNGEDNAGTSHYHKNQVVVKFKKQPGSNELARMKSDLQTVKFKKLGYTYVFESAKMDTKQMMRYFKKWNIEYVEPHFYYLTNESASRNAGIGRNFVPNDALYSEYQWNLPLVDTEKGWTVTKGNKNIIVAVIDTGVDLNHPDLKGQLLKGVNVVDEKKSPADDVGHGTHVAGIISAIVNNAEGVAGMTWYNKILPVKVLDETGAGSTYSVAQGIIWAADHGAKVINMSLGNYVEAQFLHDAIRYAYDKDVVLIAATGNDNTEEPGYPAAYPEVLAVSAIDWDKKRASFSNFGSYIDVMAPGVSIASTYPHSQYAALSGTSMASPHVAALAALIRSANPLLKNTEVMNIIRQTATDLGVKGKDKYYGYGQIDVVRAVQRAELSRHSLTFWGEWLKRKLRRIETTNE